MAKKYQFPSFKSVALSLALASGACFSAWAGEAAKVDYFADNGIGVPLAIVQHPAGIHHEGVTYVCYQGPMEDPYVAAYNHQTGEWLGPFVAGESDLGRLPDRQKVDNHGKPTLIIDNAGYIHVFFGGHGGSPEHGPNPLGNHHHGANKHAVSKRPLDISEWETLDTIPPFGTYNQAVKMDNGDIYLFYRHGAHRSDWVYQKSTDNGRSFEAPVSFLKHKRRDDLDAVDSWYAWVGRGRGDDIIVSYDYHLCWDMKAGVNGRGHTTERHDAYFMIFNTRDGSWRNVQGAALEMPVTREYANEKTLAISTGDLWTFNGSTHLDSEGHPHIAMNMGEDKGEKTGGPKSTTHIRWNGSEWIKGASLVEGDSRGDFLVTSPKAVRYILAYQEDGDAVLAWWTSEDGGLSFQKGKELLRREKAGFSVTSIIQKAHPEALLLVAERPRGSEWRKIYLIGENGPLQRDKAAATFVE